MGFLSWLQSWAAGATAGGFAAWAGFTIVAILILFVGMLYYGLIKSSDLAKSLTRAAAWAALTLFLSLMFFWASVWG